MTVNVAGDVAVEAAESFTLALQAATNTLSVPTTIDAAQDEATGTIQNDDAAAASPSLPKRSRCRGRPARRPRPMPSSWYGSARFAATGGNAEVVSFDPTSDQLYILNTTGNKIEIVKIGATGSLTKTGEIDLSTLPEFGGANSVAIKNGVVAVAYGNATAGEAAMSRCSMPRACCRPPSKSASLPDMLTFTPDGSRILVANEAEPVRPPTIPPAPSASSTFPAVPRPPPSQHHLLRVAERQRRRAGAGRPCAVPGPVGGQRHRA